MRVTEPRPPPGRTDRVRRRQASGDAARSLRIFQPNNHQAALPCRARNRITRSRKHALALLLATASLAACASVPDPPKRTSGATSHAFVDCRGLPADAPTVVLQAGAYSTSADWDLVLRDLSRSGRVCAYDRLGLGFSPDRRRPPTAVNIARNLAELLDRLGETKPIILVGHSNGAFYAEAFAILYPHRVAGLVYVDGVGTDDLDSPAVLADLHTDRNNAEWAALGGRLGLAGLFVKAKVAAIGLIGNAADRKWRDLTSARHLVGSREEVVLILPEMRRVRQLGKVASSIPVASIVATTSPHRLLDRAWRAAQSAPVGRACQGWLLEAVGASHVSLLGRDRDYIVASVRWLGSSGVRRSTLCAAMS